MSVIVVNSHVVRGSVGGRASTFALEHCGISSVSLATVTLSWHPGHGPSTRSPPARFAGHASDIAGAPWLGEVDGILSGYLGDADQAAVVAELVRALKAANPTALYLCDPVIGDAGGGGGLYVPEATARAIRDELVPHADILTPNAFELTWLTGLEASAPAETIAVATAARELAITSLPPDGHGLTGSALFLNGRAHFARHASLDGVPHGTGDLFAALYLAKRLGGLAPTEAWKGALGGTTGMAAAASRLGTEELPLAAEADQLDRSDGVEITYT